MVELFDEQNVKVFAANFEWFVVLKIQIKTVIYLIECKHALTVRVLARFTTSRLFS
jgi:predicted metal-binding protein